VAAWRQPSDHLAGPVRAARDRARPPQYQRERWDTPDGDFIDVDFLDPPGAQASPVGSMQPQVRPEPERRPLLVLFHGLEGSSRSHYAEAFADWCVAQGLAYAVPHFRGCSGELNHGPRAYHSGDFEEIDWILRRLRARQHGPRWRGPCSWWASRWAATR
jgi:predicted alpha/beta-fold hydrolase